MAGIGKSIANAHITSIPTRRSHLFHKSHCLRERAVCLLDLTDGLEFVCSCARVCTVSFILHQPPSGLPSSAPPEGGVARRLVLYGGVGGAAAKDSREGGGGRGTPVICTRKAPISILRPLARSLLLSTPCPAPTKNFSAMKK